MKKHLFALSLSLCMAFGVGSTAFGQVTEKNGTPQAPNYDFEVWDDIHHDAENTLLYGKRPAIDWPQGEPYAWNTSACFEASNSATLLTFPQSAWPSSDIRPRSKGKKSTYIKVVTAGWQHYKAGKWSPVQTSEVMGSLTTGALYYDDDKTNTKSCIYTHTGKRSKRWEFTGRPDSVVFWVKKGANGGRPADFTMYLHNNAKLEDRNPNGTSVGTVIGSASCKITNTDWQRISLPIAYASNETPAYLLASFTAGNNFREVVEGDELYVDDMMFIYNPSLHIDLEDVISLPLRKGEPLPALEVPFMLNGTMNPFNLEADNVIYVELSDENGAFDNARILASQTTETSGSFNVQLPSDLNISNRSDYKLRLRATNYPILSDNVISLDLHYVYYLTVNQNPAWAADVNTVDTLLREGMAYTANCGNILTGLHLNQWLLNGEAVSDALSYTLTMDQDYTLTAQFDTNRYAVTLQAGIGGAIEMDGTKVTDGENRYEAEIIHNAVLNLNATADFGYHFREWRLNGETLSADNPLAYTVMDAANLTAVFDTNVYEISFSATPADMGSASNSGTYRHFTAVTSTAEAAPYAKFSHWRKAGETEAVSYEATLSIESVSAEAAYEAVFASQTFDVTTAAEPAGKGQTAGDATYEAFPLTQQAQVSAQAAEGYHFTYWTYAIDGANKTDRLTDNPLVFVENDHVAHAYAFTAHFDINRYALTADAEHGMVEGDGTFEHGAEVTLSATPDYGYAFNGWYENGDLLGDEPTLTLTLTAERHLTAVCTPLTYTLTFGVNDPALGQIAQPAEAEGLYEHFSELTVTAEPTEGNEFRHWIIDGGNVNGTASLTLTVDGPKTVEAFFTPLRKQLTVLNPYEERGTVTGEGLYEHGAATELTATAAFGYVFANWTDEEGETYTANPLPFDALTENRTLTVHFKALPFDLCLYNPKPDFGSYTMNGETVADGCTTFPYLQTVTLAATPAADKRFVGWKNTETGELLTDNPLQLTMRTDISLTAEFNHTAYLVQGAAYPTEAADIAGSDDYYLNATAVLEATPRFGFTFTGWYDEQGERLTEALRYEFQVEKAVYYVARFDRNAYTLTVVSTEGGTVAGGGEQPYGYNTKVAATPDEGWQFNGWFDGQGALVSDQAVYYPTVLKDETLTAHFGPKALHITLSCEPAEAGEIKRLGQADAGFFYNHELALQAQPSEVYTFSHWTDADGEQLGESANLTLTPTSDLHLTAHFTPRADLNANICVQPANAGELVNLPQAWVYGQSYTAEVNQTDDRYTFIGWMDAEGKTRSTDMTYTFTFDNRPLVAQFEAKAVAVNIACEPAQTGEVALTGESRYFETVTLNPQAARGYRFAAWRNAEGETLDGTEAELTWTLNGDLNLTAVFEPETYDILVAAIPEAGGLIAGPATAGYGSTVTLQATANEGYQFRAYEDAEGKALSYEPAFTTTVNGPLNLNARFAPLSYTLHAVPADKTLGQTKGSGLFAFGETVTVKAWPMAAGYTFSHWSADPEGNDILSEEAEYQYTMTAENRTIYACFKPQTLQLELTANLPQAGTLQGGGEKTYGETVTLTATANEGYIWQGFSEYDVLLTEETSWTFTMTENRHIVGVFTPMMWQITAVNVPEGVKVKGTGEAAHGTEAEIEAVLPNTLDFVAWTDAEGNSIATENPLRVTVQGDLQLTPRCTPHLLPLRVTIEPLGAGQVITEGFTDNAGAFRHGEDVALEVLPARGYTFVGWEEDDVLISNANPYTYRILGESQLKAVFQPAGWTIATGSNLSLGGTTAGDGIYPQGTTVEVTATPAAGFEFMHWMENGEIVSTDAVYRFVADNNRLLLADFQIHYFQIQVEANPTIGAKVSGSGAYSAQDTVTLSVTPTNGYAFIAWECEGETLSSETIYRFVPERDMQIVAQMKKLTTTVSVSVSPFDAGTVTGGGEYRVGDQVTLTAIPNEQYIFRQWVDQRQNIVSLDQTFRFTADEDVAYIAEFAPKDITDLDPNITVYPTPFSGEVHLEGENMDKIMWFNAFGVKVAQYEINSNTHTIMTTDTWPRGLYIYRIVGNSGKVVKGKALKL